MPQWSGTMRVVCVWAVGLRCPLVVKFSLCQMFFLYPCGWVKQVKQWTWFFPLLKPKFVLDRSTLSCRGMCTSPLAGWVRCFVLNHAAKLLLFSHFYCLTKGQYPPILPSLSFLKEKCIFGDNSEKKRLLFYKRQCLFAQFKINCYLCTVKQSFEQLGEIRTCAGDVCVELITINYLRRGNRHI